MRTQVYETLLPYAIYVLFHILSLDVLYSRFNPYHTFLREREEKLPLGRENLPALSFPITRVTTWRNQPLLPIYPKV